MLPITKTSVILFASSIGILWLATVPLTSALVAQILGGRYMATLFGFVFFSHQVGSFLGVKLGGKMFDVTGSYLWIWILSIIIQIQSSSLSEFSPALLNI